MQERLFFSPSLANTASEASGLGTGLSTHPSWLNGSAWNAGLAKDALGLLGHDGQLAAAVLAIGLREATTLNPQERRLGARVGTHIGAALRLRAGRGASPDGAEAVLSPAGKIQQLARADDGAEVKEGFARRRHARSRGTTPEAALEVWQGLHDGRWSLVDYVDTDGKAFVLAVRNEPARAVASSLTDRQRAAVALAALGYGSKQIAYALGLRAAAVAMLLARARAATGVRTRAELVRSFKRSLAARA